MKKSDDTKNSNARTLQSYEEHVKEYVAGTPHQVGGDFKVWIDSALSQLKPGSTILEIGSGPGRDADYMEARGFKVERTDAAKAFVNLMQNQGHEARILNAISDDFGGPYAMVFAHAVLLHFTPEEAKQALLSAHKSLQPKGVIALTVKLGDGGEWVQNKLNAPRYFCYWQADSLSKLVKDAGFEIIEITTRKSTNSTWLHVIARKAS